MINIQKEMCNFFGSACYAYSLAYICTGKTDIKELTKHVLFGWLNDYIDDDCYVKKPIPYINHMSETKYKDVVKVNIGSLDDLPDSKMYAVEYVYGAKHHFVVCQKGKGIVFDPWFPSETATKGKPITYRLFV